MHSNDFPPAFPLQPFELFSASVVAKELAIPRLSAETLMRAQVASAMLDSDKPTTFANHLGRPVITADGLSALKQNGKKLDPEHFEHLLPAVNVRVREARCVDDPDRKYMGWHPSLDERDANLSTSRWWPVPRHDVTGHSFLVTVSGYVVRCGRIEGYLQERGQVAYNIDWNVKEISNALLHRRIATPQGGSCVYL